MKQEFPASWLERTCMKCYLMTPSPILARVSGIGCRPAPCLSREYLHCPKRGRGRGLMLRISRHTMGLWHAGASVRLGLMGPPRIGVRRLLMGIFWGSRLLAELTACGKILSHNNACQTPAKSVYAPFPMCRRWHFASRILNRILPGTRPPFGSARGNVCKGAAG